MFLFSFKPPFSGILLNPEEIMSGTREGMKFWIEKLVINLTNELGFSGTQVQESGEGNGTPLQYSCLENPLGGGAW